jgi:hypothetical protein
LGHHKNYRTPAAAFWMLVAAAFLLAVWSGAYSIMTSIGAIARSFLKQLKEHLCHRLNKRKKNILVELSLCNA